MGVTSASSRVREEPSVDASLIVGFQELERERVVQDVDVAVGDLGGREILYAANGKCCADSEDTCPLHEITTVHFVVDGHDWLTAEHVFFFPHC